MIIFERSRTFYSISPIKIRYEQLIFPENDSSLDGFWQIYLSLQIPRDRYETLEIQTIDCTISDDTKIQTNPIEFNARQFALPYSVWHSFVFLDYENAMMFAVVYAIVQQSMRLWYTDLVWRKHHVEDSLHEDLIKDYVKIKQITKSTVDFYWNWSCHCFDSWDVIIIMN